VAESENIYVKIGERGRLIERTAERDIDHANLRARGWVLKGAKDAPTKKDEFAEAPIKSGLTNISPTSVRAQADVTEDTSGSRKAAGSGAGSSTAGARADEKSQAAAGS
jgi:hypothetical protein